MKNPLGIVAAGHQDTVNAASTILAAGGNAFDAALAALFSSCVCEPVLSSLGGGGFLLAHSRGGNPVLYDFFAHTPSHKPPQKELEFHPIIADFGTAQQEFHIGMGSIAVPGMVRGVYAIHSGQCSLPLEEIIQPALHLAREGVRINSFQHYISTIVAPIIKSSPAALQLHESCNHPGAIAPKGETVKQPHMADLFSALVEEGEDLFYRGELAHRLVDDCKTRGGAIRLEDLEKYRVESRTPLSLNYRGTRLFSNPAPSIGGTLIAFTLALLEQEGLCNMPHQGIKHLAHLAHAMRLTQQLRQSHDIDSDLDAKTSRRILGSDFIDSYRHTLRNHASCSRGTTQISVADAKGNMASMTLSNGEGSGYVLPGTGIMLNNMLGEEDINPRGFHQWPEDRRIASMMAPTLAFMPNGNRVATGSGGSNRIRSSILQLLINLIDFKLDIPQAVEQPRIHFETNLLNMEHGIPDLTVEDLTREFTEHHLWPDRNLFFGGAHTVMLGDDGSLHGQGDSRRGGVCIQV
ncbi:MAG: gamma-glutamyltransferase [Gammaproteobacteria bacterium]|nr:gamma-glutamyltransferase [Gammaproteobacteria bacterium]